MYILAALGGRMEAAGIYTQSGGCCVKILLSFPSKPKTEPPLLSLYYRQESLCIFGGLQLSKNEAQARRRRRRFQGIRGQPCVKDTVVVISDLYIRFRHYYLLLPDVSGPSEKNNSWLKLLISPLFLPKKKFLILFFYEISLTYSYNSKGALKEFWRKM